MRLVKIGIAILLMIGVIYWAYDSTSARSYAGSQLEFMASNGNIVSLTHDADSPLALDITARGNFNVKSTIAELSGGGTREGSGRQTIYRRQMEIPSGTVDLQVTRGSELTFKIDDPASVQAVVTPLSPEAARNTMIAALVVLLGSLYYISNVFQHRWLKAIVRKVSNRRMVTPRPSTSQVGS